METAIPLLTQANRVKRKKPRGDGGQGNQINPMGEGGGRGERDEREGEWKDGYTFELLRDHSFPQGAGEESVKSDKDRPSLPAGRLLQGCRGWAMMAANVFR